MTALTFTRIESLLKVERKELPALAWAFLYFFLLLCSYYILRPVRDEMGIQSGVKNLPQLFAITFGVMLLITPLFGWVVARFPRRKLLPVVYLFFAANLALFFLAFTSKTEPVTTAKAFFVWVSVFNFFVVSVFWSFMADLFTNDQAKRLFGVVAAGGSAGAIAGPLITSTFVSLVGIANLLIVSAALLLATIYCIYKLSEWADLHGTQQKIAPDAIIGGNVWAGIRLTFSSSYLLTIAWYVLLLTLLATFLYVEQQRIVSTAIRDPELRTQLFAHIDLGVNIATLLIEVFLTGRLVSKLGVSMLLMLLPLINLLGYLSLALLPTLGVLIMFQAMRRAAEYAIAKPVREILFTVVDRERKYKAKNFIDTSVSRGGDALSSWFVESLNTLGAGLAQIAVFAIPIAAVTALMGYGLGKRQEALRGEAELASLLNSRKL